MLVFNQHKPPFNIYDEQPALTVLFFFGSDQNMEKNSYAQALFAMTNNSTNFKFLLKLANQPPKVIKKNSRGRLIFMSFLHPYIIIVFIENVIVCVEQTWCTSQ